MPKVGMEEIRRRQLIDATIAALPSRRSDFSVNRALSDADGKQGMLFGDARWLGIALTALLEEMGASAPVQAQAALRAGGTGSRGPVPGWVGRCFIGCLSENG